ncbi:hypothetical protein [Actinomadura macra]|uniref:hypothetical protein n=1 Tax=Actinomadura macra TaxID=46164 RepID=UPI0008350CE6|nr:hypothetical protein [Actinomadura macra]
MASLDQVRTLLRCLAAEPRLGGALFYDLEPALLVPLARRLAGALPGPPKPLVLGAHAGTEDLFVQTRLDGDVLRTVRGPLAAERGAVVIVPDLARVDPPVAQTIVTMAGAELATAEVLGRSLRWQPRTWWLAAAPRAEVAGLSAHLLDRFPIRVRADRLYLEWTGAADAAGETGLAAEEAALMRGLPEVEAPDGTGGPPLSGDAVRRVLDFLPPGPSRRRDLTLARAARLLAGFAGAAATGAAHVEEAAEMLGIPRRPAPASPPVAEPAPSARPEPRPLPPPPPPAGDVRGTRATAPAPRPVAGRSGPAVPLPAAVAEQAWPYPEDEAGALPRLGTLRPAGGRHTRARELRGRPLGVRPAFDLRDLAIVATVVEAAKFQRVRRTNRPDAARGLLVAPADLRRPRRQPEPGSALVLVLDHSCWRHFDPAPGMAAFLRAAHRDDAAVSVIEFGHRDNPDELRAVRYRARSVLDPRVLASLRRAAGLASPLAHALDLAVTEVRRLLRRGPLPVSLVVASDGRGNVPLDDSLLGTVRAAVGRRGVSAALVAASPLRVQRGVEAVVLAPDVDQYPGLPFDLAEAMGGSVITAPRRDDRR